MPLNHRFLMLVATLSCQANYKILIPRIFIPFYIFRIIKACRINCLTKLKCSCDSFLFLCFYFKNTTVSPKIYSFHDPIIH